MTALLVASALSLLVGFISGRSYAKHEVRHRKATGRETTMSVGRPLDLERCEYTTFWQEPR